MRGAQPALRDRRVRIDRALEHDLLHVGREHPQHQNRSASLVEDETNSFAGDRPGDLGLALPAARVRKVRPSPIASKLSCRLAVAPASARERAGGIEIELASSACARSAIRSRPRSTNWSTMAHLQQHPRLLRPAVVLALQEMVEEALLQLARRNRCRSASSARCRAPRAISASTAARTKPSKLPRGCSPWPPQLAAESNGTVDLRPVRRARAVVVVVERMGADLVAEVAAVARQLFVGQCLGAAHRARRARGSAGRARRAPYCTVFTCMSYQLRPERATGCRRDASCRDTSRRRPPRCTWRRGAAAASEATCHWLMA